MEDFTTGLRKRQLYNLFFLGTYRVTAHPSQKAVHLLRKGPVPPGGDIRFRSLYIV